MKERFLARKKTILNQFNFDIVVTALRATKFGWGAHINQQTDEQVKSECCRLASRVMNSAIEYALQNSREAWSGCGGFKATAWPNGELLLEFVLAEEGDWFGEPDEDADEAQSTVHIGEPITIGRRRILKLHKEN